MTEEHEGVDIIFCGTTEEKMREADLSDAYLHRSNNRNEVTPGDDQDAPCACAYCCSTFDGSWIWQWAGSDHDRARCPVCGLDAVISILHVPKMADPEFRDAMYARFYDTATWDDGAYDSVIWDDAHGEVGDAVLSPETVHAALDAALAKDTK